MVRRYYTCETISSILKGIKFKLYYIIFCQFVSKKIFCFLQRDVIFINTHMDFCGGLVFLPYTRILEGPKYKFLFNLNLYDNVNETDGKSSKNVPTYNLFYNGLWNKPVKGNYWTHDNSLWANATMYIFCLILILIELILKFKMYK